MAVVEAKFPNHKIISDTEEREVVWGLNGLMFI